MSTFRKNSSQFELRWETCSEWWIMNTRGELNGTDWWCHWCSQLRDRVYERRFMTRNNISEMTMTCAGVYLFSSIQSSNKSLLLLVRTTLQTKWMGFHRRLLLLPLFCVSLSDCSGTRRQCVVVEANRRRCILTCAGRITLKQPAYHKPVSGKATVSRKHQ